MTGVLQLKKRQTGFTLIELMIVIIIVGILVTVALPAYRNQVIRGSRTAAQAEMMDLANRQEQFLLANRSYVDDPNDLSYVPDPDVVDKYVISINLGTTTVPSFTIVADPIGAQASDGQLTLNSQGVGTPADKWER